MASERNGQVGLKTIRPTSSLNRRVTRTQSISQRVRLETVLGLTVTSNACLAIHPSNGTVAYTAGCVVVLLDPLTDTQQHLIVPNKRTLSALAYNSDGRFFATGECGTQPCLRIWDTKEAAQIVELIGHKNGITLVAFSPDSKYIISVGTHHDNLVIVWDWRNNRKIAANKVTCKVKGAAFAEDGSFFVTVGNRHVKYWYLEVEKDARGQADVMPLVGRSAVLGNYKDECFLDVVCGRGTCAEYTYAVTQSGFVCQFNSQRSLEKRSALKSSSGTCLSAGESGIIVGCAGGIVRVFDPSLLTIIATLPFPHPMGVDVMKYTKSEDLARRSADESLYPDCVAISFDEVRDRVVVIYNDHSIYVWDVHDPKRTTKLCSHLYHSRCVWGVDVYSAAVNNKPCLPAGSFISCSSDDTVRIWNTSPARMLSETGGMAKENTDIAWPTNLFCSYTINIFYNDPALQYLSNKEINPGGVDPLDVHIDSKYGIRCVRFDPHGEQVAFGDRLGNIHIYELSTMRETYKIEAHASEVLCLEYSKPDSGYKLLASASRDRLIQIFDVKNDYDCLQTLDDHSASITALRFAALNGARQFGLISCGVDKAVILRTVQYSEESGPKFLLNDQILSKGGIVYDMDIDTTSQSIVTANQDRQLRVYGIKSRKQEKTMKGSASDEGALIKLDLNDSGRFIATSCSDKNLAIIDAVNGDCWAAFSGHSEIVTGLKFNPAESSLISVSGDGCIFVWRVAIDSNAFSPRVPATTDAERPPLPLSPMNSVASMSEMSASGSEALDEELQEILQSNNGFPLDAVPLPGWAKLAERSKIASSPLQDPSAPRVRGRWADEMDQVFLQDDLVGESTDSAPFSISPGLSTNLRATPPSSSDDPLQTRRQRTSVSSVSSSSTHSSETQKRAQSMFIPFRPDSPMKATENHTKGTLASKSSQQTEKDTLGRRSPLLTSSTPGQPSILGFLGSARKPLKNEFDDDDEDLRPRKPVNPAILRVQNEVSSDKGIVDHNTDGDSESASNVSTSSPSNSRPDTPSEAANRFLNLSTSGIDKVLRSRLPHRQSVTIKHQSQPEVPEEIPKEEPPQKIVPQLSPSKRLIQSAKLSANRQKFKSTQNLSAGQTFSVATPEEGALTSSQGSSAHDIRRATSMTNLSTGDAKDRSGLDGYNSLLERAKARLASTGKQKPDEKSPTSKLMSKPLVVGNIPDSLSSAQKAEISPEKSRDRLNSQRLSIGNLRSRSGERSPNIASSPVNLKTNGENQIDHLKKPESPVNTIKTLLERRARESSASRSTNSVTLESPTSAAIARIKADIGLAGKNGDVNGSTKEMSMENYRQQFLNLLRSMDKMIDDLRNVDNASWFADHRTEFTEISCDALVDTKSKLLEMSSILQNLTIYTGSENSTDRTKLINLRNRINSILNPAMLPSDKLK